MKVEISKIIGGTISEEVNKLIEIYSSNSELIEQSFLSLKQNIKDLEQRVVDAIKEGKN